MSRAADNPQFAEQREWVTAWLKEDGYAVQELPQPPAFAWLLVATNQELGEYGISQLRERPAVVHVSGFMDLQSVAGARVKDLGDDHIWQLRLGLLSMGLDSFTGLERPVTRVTLGANLRSLAQLRALSSLTRARYTLVIAIYPWRQSVAGESE